MTYNFPSEYAAEAIHVKSVDRSTAQSDPLGVGGCWRFCTRERVWISVHENLT
jgi:hypothetical protein